MKNTAHMSDEMRIVKKIFDEYTIHDTKTRDEKYIENMYGRYEKYIRAHYPQTLEPTPRNTDGVSREVVVFIYGDEIVYIGSANVKHKNGVRTCERNGIKLLLEPTEITTPTVKYMGSEMKTDTVYRAVLNVDNVRLYDAWTAVKPYMGDNEM